jgi:hypothetical protein
MAKHEFLNQLRHARNLFFHAPDANGSGLGRSAIWLTPASVQGFHKDDFAELPPAQQDELEQAVAEFSSIASQVPASGTPSDEQVRDASVALKRILDLLNRYVPASQSEEESRIAQAMQQVSLPHWVINWDFEYGWGIDNEPLIWIYLYVDENGATREQLVRETSRIASELLHRLVTLGVNRWPSVRLRSIVAQKIA